MKKLYIVLIKAHTGLGSIARKITHYPYTHISLSLGSELEDFISYSRRYHNYPFDAGFTHEYRDCYAFGKHKSFGAKVFELSLSDVNYKNVLAFIKECEGDSEQLFNIYSMATMPVIGGFRVYKANNCMSFTAKVIELSGCVELAKPYYRYSIKDMDALLGPFTYFEGKITKHGDIHPEYMKPFRLKKYLGDMLRLLPALTYRLIFK